MHYSLPCLSHGFLRAVFDTAEQYFRAGFRRHIKYILSRKLFFNRFVVVVRFFQSFVGIFHRIYNFVFLFF